MNKNLILTGWGRSDYAVAAAVALRAIGEADVLGVSMRRLADALEKESVGRESVYVLGVGLGNEAEAFAEVASRVVAKGTVVSYLSMFKMEVDVREVVESTSVRLGVFAKAKSLAEVAEMFFDVEAGDLHPYAIERKEGESSSAAKYQDLFRAAGYIHRTNGDDGIYAESIRSLAACIKPEAWPQSLSNAVKDYRKYGKRELLGHSPAMEEEMGFYTKAKAKFAKATRFLEKNHPEVFARIAGFPGSVKTAWKGDPPQTVMLRRCGPSFFALAHRVRISSDGAVGEIPHPELRIILRIRVQRDFYAESMR